ncbi:restriction endonuclease, partial [Actinophytocola sp.]|uniref:restriction endonuclease n=1 Tax=Actinophytocola sp. TaxID=1872138 RepID=UPI00389AF395
MDSFDLGRLTDFDFEILCKDLFTEILGLEFEVFSPGADGGIDLRHLSSHSGKVIVQCKHWKRSGRAALINHIKEKEVEKVRKLKPDRYILATTAELTRHSKDSLYDTLRPYSLSPSDIFGIDEIASQLRNNPDLVRKHLRLWLNSAA